MKTVNITVSFMVNVPDDTPTEELYVSIEPKDIVVFGGIGQEIKADVIDYETVHTDNMDDAAYGRV